jgi:hypothetical protein
MRVVFKYENVLKHSDKLSFVSCFTRGFQKKTTIPFNDKLPNIISKPEA